MAFNKAVIAAITLTIAIIIAVIAHQMAIPHERVLKVFHAGSLIGVLKDIKAEFEAIHPGVVVKLEPSGSVMAVRKIVELHKHADVVIVADYSVIERYLMPKYASWYVKFASNEVVLAYTNRSKYANEVNASNWYEILLRPGVKLGISNPNLDPCGYRALAILYMASLYYNNSDIWNELVLRHIPNVKVEVRNGTHYIYFPANPRFKPGKLVVRDKSVDLIGLLEAGIIDYAFEYKSVAEGHGLKYVELPPVLSLKENPLINVTVVLYSGDFKREVPVKIKTVVYGLTIPSVCEECDLALEFVRFILYDKGKEILKRHGFVVLGHYEYVGTPPKALAR